MNSYQASDIAFEQFLKNYKTYLFLKENGHVETASRMILLEVCITFFLLNDDLRKNLFQKIKKIKDCDFLNEDDETDEDDLLTRIKKIMVKLNEH